MRRLSKMGSKINSKIGKAIADHGLISEGDRILVAVSGGKDSMTLLYILKKIQGWAPVKFDLIAAHITTDFSCDGASRREGLECSFDEIGVRGVFGHVDVLDSQGETNCFWCSWNKRKALFGLAEENFCNKIALGHHKDDIIETVLLNLLFKGEISSMNPRQDLFGGKITLIRPLCYVDEKLIRTYAKEGGFVAPPFKCPFGDRSKRKIVKELVAELEKKAPGSGIRTNIFSGVSRIKHDYIGTAKSDRGPIFSQK